MRPGFQGLRHANGKTDRLFHRFPFLNPQLHALQPPGHPGRHSPEQARHDHHFRGLHAFFTHPANEQGLFFRQFLLSHEAKISKRIPNQHQV